MSYLDEEKMNAFINEANIRQLAKIWIGSYDLIFYWGMYTLEDFFELIDKSIPEICKFVDIDKIKKRAYKIRAKKLSEKSNSNEIIADEFLPIGFKTKGIQDVVPELIKIKNIFQEAFISVPNGVKKTEAWLYAHALKARDDASLEALIYFKSQGETLIPATEISEAWRQSMCFEVEMDNMLNHNNKTIIQKAKNKELSIAELEVQYSSNHFPEFLSARDNEEEFISSTFFRAVEWLELTEFEPWINGYIQDISTLYQGGVDETYSLFYLFYFCRSDLILRKASRFGIEAILLGICSGNIDYSKPWKRYWQEFNDNKEREINIVDYLPTASIIAFSWKRIQPDNIDEKVLKEAISLLFQTQLESGAWPLTTNNEKDDLFSTYLAMLAIGISKPKGYQRIINKAKKWLLSQQSEVGCWNIDGGPSIMINILCLEAIKLAEGDDKLTYSIGRNIFSKESINTKNNLESEKIVVFCEGNPRGKGNKSFDEKCYEVIFKSEFPNVLFHSVGSCTDLESNDNKIIDFQTKMNPSIPIIKLIDRDDRSDYEIEELSKKGIRVLSLRELESYLLEDEIIIKLCHNINKLDKVDDVLSIKSIALLNSIKNGKPTDDLKSAAGEFYINIKAELQLTQCGNNYVSFLRDTMAPLITHDTVTYKKLKEDIFGI